MLVAVQMFQIEECIDEFEGVGARAGGPQFRIQRQFLPYQKYGLNVAAGYSYEGLFPVLLNGWAGAYGAYEQVNNGNTRSPLYSSVIPGDIKGFIYGLSGSAELEIFLARKVSLLVNYTQYYDLKSSFSKSNYGVFGGLKYSFN